MDMAYAAAAERGCEFLLFSEPNVARVSGSSWLTDNGRGAAIGAVGRWPGISGPGRGNGFVWVGIAGVAVYSCYISPNVGDDVFDEFVSGLEQDLRGRDRSRVILTGDFNAKSFAWGCAVEDGRGERLSSLFASLDLLPINTHGVPTFVRGDSRSTIDLTVVSSDLVTFVGEWSTLEEEVMFSPHRAIVFRYGGRATRADGWRRGPIDQGRFEAKLAELHRARTGATPLWEWLPGTVKRACKFARGWVRERNGRTPYWWSAGIADIRTETVRGRRTLTRLRTRGASPQRIEAAAQEYKRKKSALKKAINTAKRECWRDLVARADEEIFGQAYQLVTRSLRVPRQRLELSREDERAQADALFPGVPLVPWTRGGHGAARLPPPRFTREELQTAVRRVKPKKAPGPDGVPPEAIKLAAATLEDTTLAMVNDLLGARSFPTPWKMARLVLIPKGPPADKRFRPICLVNSVAKLYEQLLKMRLEAELERTVGISQSQHGFRAGHSTTSATRELLDYAGRAHRDSPSRHCLVVLLDVQNAFNTARWAKIVEALERREVAPYIVELVKDYFTGRCLLLRDGERRPLSMGVPQGSVLGPTLWNVMYDDIFRLPLRDGFKIVGYADDVAVLGTHKSWEALLAYMNEAVGTVGRWLADQGLGLAADKTVAVQLRFGRPAKPGLVRVEGLDIPLSDGAKYLGFWLDPGLSFGPHIKMSATKAERTTAALARIMPNMGGPAEASRRVLAATAQSIMSYGAPIWADRLAVARYKGYLASVQRRLMLRICRGYRTASLEAAAVIASLIPIHLRCRERARLTERTGVTSEEKRSARRETLDACQEEWAAGEKGAWTRRLIPDVRPWVGRRHGQTSYFLTQGLSGHGSFGQFRSKIGKVENGDCTVCAVLDSPEHALFECPRGHRARTAAETSLGRLLSADTMIEVMLESAARWRVVERMVTQIMSARETEERGQEN